MTAPQWRFESFRLDPVNACLWWDAEAVVLTPKTFDVLYYLVQHADRLVTKDELLDAVWPETAVSDGVVRMAISALRKALDDTAQTPRFIATVPRRGYRFVAVVTRIEPPVTSYAGELPPVTSPPPRYESGPLALTLTAPAEQSHTAQAALAGERKQVTVLFADVVGSTELIRDRDPEDGPAPARRRVQRDDGRRPPLRGHRQPGDGRRPDGAVRGAARPRGPRRPGLLRRPGDAGGRCARYAEEARRAARRRRRRSGSGSNSGEVVVRLISRRPAHGLHGDGPDRPPGLADGAARDARVRSCLTADTLALVEGYVQVRSLGPVPVKGLAEPVEVFELLGAGVAADAPPGGRRARPDPFVGREAEMAALHAALERARLGRARSSRWSASRASASRAWSGSVAHSHRTRAGWCWRAARSRTARRRRTCRSSTCSRATAGSSRATTPAAIREKVDRQAAGARRGAAARRVPALLALLDVAGRGRRLAALDPAAAAPSDPRRASSACCCARARSSRCCWSSRICTGSTPRPRRCSTPGREPARRPHPAAGELPPGVQPRLGQQDLLHPASDRPAGGRQRRRAARRRCWETTPTSGSR